MIQLYPKGQTDYSRRGIEIHAAKASVTYQDNGRFDIDVEMPMPEGITVDYGMILRCTVPKQEIAAIRLGTVSYWQVNADNVPLYGEVPTLRRIYYSPWRFSQASSTQAIYSVGDKCTYANRNYECTAYDPSSPLAQVPPSSSPWWTEIANTVGKPGKILATLNTGDMVFKTGDFNDTYMKASDMAGHEGFIQIAKCTDMSQTEERIIPAQTIEEQSFVITEIQKSTDGKRLSLHAEHVSYGLGRIILGDCNLVRVNPATAVMLIKGAMKEPYGGEIYTNLTEETVSGDWSWKNAQNAILDPKAGLLQATSGHMIRNDLDVFLLKSEEPDPRYKVTYGTNMQAVDWDGSVTDMVTRIYPTAQTEDGNTLLLPEEHIDTVRTVPFVRPEVLNTGLKVGTEEEQSDGTKIKLDEATVFARMREAANNRFSVDECDKAEITLEVDWIHLPDTEEYAQYAALRNAAPGEWVQVDNGPLGISEVIQLTGYTFDPILCRYEKCKFGKNKVKSTVSSHDIKSGAVTGKALAAGSVGGQNIQANAITAREIETNSITADKIASKSIQTELIAAGAITADEINAGAVTAEKVAAGAITAEKIQAGAVETEHLDAYAVTAEKVAAGAITADKIGAEAITAEKIAAGSITALELHTNAVTTEKLDAYAVTAEKLAADSVTADKIDANSITAINAKLGVAEIATAAIRNADIDYAHIVRLDAQGATIESLIARDAVTDKYFIDKLAVRNAQMVQATVGELVIKASNNKYYRLDVAANGSVSPTEVTPSASEIASGVTSDGHGSIIETDLTVADLSASNMKAVNALIDKITASRIDVDELWARQAFINKLMVQDISSNTYIQSTIGDWSSGSTITQSINSLDSRISSLGYGTVYMQPEEPSHSELVAGDIWIQTQSSGTWQEVYNDYSSWQDIYDNVSTWQTLGGVSIMWVWDGRKWQEQLNALDSDTFETEIEQNRQSISLLASRTTAAEGNIEQLSASLSVANDAIAAEVQRATNAEDGKLAKTSSYQTADSIVSAAVAQARSDASGSYIAKTETYQDAASIVLTAESYADGKASSAESNAKSYANNNFYALKSGISILATGVEISGGRYIKILSGSTAKMLLNEDGIDMQTAGKFYLHAKDSTNSAIIIGTNKQTASFSVGQSGDVTCKSITTDSITVNGGGLPKFVISEGEPSGTGLIWIKPSSSTSKTWAITPNPRILSKSPSSLGNNTYYEDYTISYSADDYLAGNLKYGVTVKLWFYGLSTVEQHTLKARLKNGSSWIDIGSITQNVWQYNTLTLDVMLSSAKTNVMSVSGGSFTLRIESTAGQAKAQLPNENIVLRAQTSGGSGVATCAVFYKQ